MDTIAGPDLLPKLRARFGERGVLTDPADTAPYCEEDWRRRYRGRTPAAATGVDAGGGRRGAAMRRGRGGDGAAGREYQHGRRRRRPRRLRRRSC